MVDYRSFAEKIPWASSGRETVASRVGKSLLPIALLPYDAPPYDPTKPGPFVSNKHSAFESILPNIVGTAIQGGEGKLVTCAHVVEAVIEHQKKGYAVARAFRENRIIYSSRPFQTALRYVDPRSGAVNSNVDLAVIPYPAISVPEMPYEVPTVRWGDSAGLGVGDEVMIGGYPYGTELFLLNTSNRGLVQPTFYSGIISAIIPALKEQETRILQISVAVAGGMSGGAVLDPKMGEVVGIITSGLTGADGSLHPVSYALPSEIIAPFVRSINYVADDGKRWGVDDNFS